MGWLICGKKYKTRVGLYYWDPDRIRAQYNPNFKGEITDINKQELGCFFCLPCEKNIKRKRK
jgi:hypothetical protein